MDIVSIAGSIASLWGAWYAWKQAKESKLAASLAEKIKKQLIQNRDIENISKLGPLAKSAIDKMRKYSVNRGEVLSGISPEYDAEYVQEYISELYAYADYFPDNKVNNLYNKVNGLIQKFVATNIDSERKQFGNEIHNELVAFSLVLNQISKKYSSTTEIE